MSVIESERLARIQNFVTPEEWAAAQTSVGLDATSGTIVECLVKNGALTSFQADGINRDAFAGLRIGNYDVLDRIGAGGMGTVFKARHRRMRRVVAVKVLARQHCDDPQFVNRFQREVQTMAHLTHPNIVTAYDADEADVGHFLVMEFVDGADLASYAGREQVSIRECVRAIADAARGLSYAHKRGIIHRDIKPANLLRDRTTGVVKVTDLGLARPAEATPQNVGITHAGSVLGTADYMSPEQAVDATTLGPSTDVYSLGGTLFAMLTGSAPYRSNTLMGVLLLHRDGPIPDPRTSRPDVPETLADLVRRMLGKKPAERPASMDDVVSELEAIEAELGAEARIDEHAATAVFSEGLPALSPLDGRPVLQSISVYIVEPSRTQARIIKQCLEATETSAVEIFASGVDLLARLCIEPADVVVSAMHLPDMNGAKLAEDVRTMRGSKPDLKATGFVLVTSASESADAVGLSSAGLAVTLRKPFTPEQLVHALELAVGARLPTKAAGLAASFVLTPPKSAPSLAAKPSFATRKVLLVDDSSAARMFQRKALEEIGFKDIVEAPDGARAVASTATQTFDLIVTDYNMPIMDGAALVGYLRANPATATIPIVMVTTETSAEKLDPIRRLNVAGIIEKKFPVDVMRRLVEKLW